MCANASRVRTTWPALAARAAERDVDAAAFHRRRRERGEVRERHAAARGARAVDVALGRPLELVAEREGVVQSASHAVARADELLGQPEAVLPARAFT